MTRPSARPFQPPDIRVMIHDGRGRYLGGVPENWFLSKDRSLAMIFSYHADHVAEQLEQLREIYGLELQPEPVPLEEIYETCDHCKELFMPMMTYFDGKRFLCPECRNCLAARSRARERRIER